LATATLKSKHNHFLTILDHRRRTRIEDRILQRQNDGNMTHSEFSQESKTGRLLAVGDIHGCCDLLQQLMRQVAPCADDQVVFLGDYIDRGPDSRGVIDYLLDFRERWPQTVFLKGNHEAMLLDFLAGRERLRYLLNGGETTLYCYRKKGLLTIPPRHLQFIRDLRLLFETEHHLFVHAGLRPGISPQNQREEDLLWIREDFLKSDYRWGKTVVFGHTPMRKPHLKPDRIGLDTGAAYGRSLSCCDVVSRKIWIAQAQQQT
jgi:serine/threonine protein phosphatase 1